MSWTAPRTWVSGETLTAALLNTHLRDNMLETEAAKATGGGLFFGSALNSIVERKVKYDQDLGSTTTNSLTYVTTGSITRVTTTTSDRALVMWSANWFNNTTIVRNSCSVSVTGASAIPATDDYAISRADADASGSVSTQWMGIHFFVALTPGSNTFTMEYRVTDSASTGTWEDRRLLVIPM